MTIRMNSVYARVLSSTLAILAFALVIFLLIVRVTDYSMFQTGGPFGGLLGEQVEQARNAYETAGPTGLSAQLQALAKLYPHTARYLLDNSGRDLVTGADLSRLLRSANSTVSRFNLFAPVYVRQVSANGRFILLFTPSEMNTLKNLVVYYVLLLIAIGLLCAVLAVQFVSPLNRLTQTVQQFGAGNLKARSHLDRHDEIGELARTFDNMAERLQNLLIAERRLLQDISHELGSPLARLSFAAELARTSPDREGAIAKVRKEIDRMDELIVRLLQITSAQGDPEALSPEPLVVNDIMRAVIDDCGVEAAARGCRLSVNSTRRLTVRGDTELLRRAFENVIRNAIHHAPEDTEIEITLQKKADEALIAVRDYGPGVPDEFLRDIFKPFFRVDDSRDISTGGTGLGLSIVERAIAIHHGKVWAENANPGLRIQIALPADPAGAHSVERGPAMESLMNRTA
jgi:signal transduction histidine kinase